LNAGLIALVGNDITPELRPGNTKVKSIDAKVARTMNYFIFDPATYAALNSTSGSNFHQEKQVAKHRRHIPEPSGLCDLLLILLFCIFTLRPLR
jgi:hypothetical protein